MMKFSDGNGIIARLKNWFFKGRINKTLLNEKRIENLSREYTEGKILKIE